MQMGFARIARVANLGNRIANSQTLINPREDRTFVKVSQQYVSIGTAQDHVVASKMTAINLWNFKVGQTIDRCDHFAVTRRNHSMAENHVAARICGHDTVCPKPPAIGCNDIDTMARRPIWLVLSDGLVQQRCMGIHGWRRPGSPDPQLPQ